MTSDDLHGRGTVSVIVPAFNVADYIDDCLESIAEQSYTDLEVWVIDDGSSDETADRVMDHVRDDLRFKLLRQANTGVAAARNSGLVHARGRWILFVDADDMLPSNAIEKMVSIAMRTEVGCVAGKYALAGSSGEDTHLDAISEGAIEVVNGAAAIQKLLYQRGIVNAPFAKLYDSKTIGAIRFPVGISVAEDLYFNFEAMRLSNVAIVDVIVYRYRHRTGSAMNSKFSPSRMDGLVMTRLILEAAQKEADPRVARAAECRLFMEAIFVGSMKHRQNSEYVRECKEIMRLLRKRVLLDRAAPLVYRCLAGGSLLSRSTMLRMFSWRANYSRRAAIR